jgi:hypothetical protein
MFNDFCPKIDVGKAPEEDAEGEEEGAEVEETPKPSRKGKKR